MASFPVIRTLLVLLFIFFILQIIQTFHFLYVSATVQERRLVDDSGFINIDCGIAVGSYNFQSNGLKYTCDEKYISTGKNANISSNFNTSDLPPISTTLRSFPEGLRNCYNLWPVKPNNKYLIRARFVYGNYDGEELSPSFDVYIGVNFWFTLPQRPPNFKVFMEIIHVATAGSIDVCLVNIGQGTPFISALELRPVDNSSYPASKEFSLSFEDRVDVGGVATAGSYYYTTNDDIYDRGWFKNTSWPDWNIKSTNEVVDTSHGNPCKVPASVLMTCVESKDVLVYKTRILPILKDGIPQVYAFNWYFAELELLGPNDTREFNIFVPQIRGYKSALVSPNYLQVTTISSPRISLNTSGLFSFRIMKTNNSNRYPILNAFELYQFLNFPALPTHQEDVDAVNAIKDKYEVTLIWQGDPCLPVNYQWDGLNCTYEATNPPRITSLNLSSSNLTGELPPSLSKLTSLKHLNLSNNGFTGKIPEFLAYIPSLNVIDLSGNDLTGPIPRGLAEKVSNKSIDLRLEGNHRVCNSYICEKKMEVNKKRRNFIIIIVMCVVFVTLLVISSIVFLAFKRRKKQGLVKQSIKLKNKQFNSSDIAQMTNDFRKVVGKGGFGIVYYGVLQDGTEVAVKILKNTSSTINVKQFCVEAELLTRIHHVNLVSLIGYCDEHANMALVYEYMSRGNLQTHLSERNKYPLSWKARLQISIDAAQGLEYLHSGCRPPIVHRDIKPANILLDEKGHAKISDFGLCRYCPSDDDGVAMTDVAGTRGYLDPECWQLKTLSEKSDVYGFGIVLLQLLTSQPTFIKSANSEDLPIHIVNWVSPFVESGDISAIVDKRLERDLDINSASKFLEIAMECVKSQGSQRPSMSKVVADLKLCYPNEGFHNQNPLPSTVRIDDGGHMIYSGQLVGNSSFTCTLPR